MTSHLMNTYKRWPVEFESGRGCKLFDTGGKEYLDLIGGLAVMSLGHSHPKVVAAIADQAQRLVHVSNLYSTRLQEDLASRLASISSGKLSFFCNSGAEAIECALKLVRRWSGPDRRRVIAAAGAFHGRTLGALTVTGQPSKQEPFRPLLPGVTHIPYDDAGALEDALDDDVAAVLLEPIQGEAGVVVPSDDYLPIARKLCDESGSLLILDEIQTGVGRTGRWFASDHTGVTPDVVCLAKALAGGLPIGVCLADPRVAGAFRPGDHASTFGGGAVQMAAALAVLDAIEEEGLVQRAAEAGTRLIRGLNAIFGPRAEVRGKGFLVAAELDADLARDVTSAALEKGVLVNDATPRVVRLAPPLVITDEEIDHGLAVLGEVWREVSAA